jgi:Tfp pilus assembly protein PilF
MVNKESLVRYDLAELYMKLKNYEKAEKVIRTAMEQQKGKPRISNSSLYSSFNLSVRLLMPDYFS